MPIMTSQILKFQNSSKNKNLNILREKHCFLKNVKIIYSCFITSVCLSEREKERESDNQGNREKHHCSWVFRAEIIKKAKGTT